MPVGWRWIFGGQRMDNTVTKWCCRRLLQKFIIEENTKFKLEVYENNDVIFFFSLINFMLRIWLGGGDPRETPGSVCSLSLVNGQSFPSCHKMVAATPSITLLYISLSSWKKEARKEGERDENNFFFELIFPIIRGEIFPESTQQTTLSFIGHMVTLGCDYLQKRMKLPWVA